MSQPQTHTQKGPLFAYRSFIEKGELHEDSAQEYAAEKLQLLWDKLSEYQIVRGTSGWRKRLGLARRKVQPRPQGLYLYGPVGR